MTDSRLIEVHGNDGASHEAAARRVVERDVPGCRVTDVRPAGFRCDHGYIVWEVTYNKEGNEE